MEIIVRPTESVFHYNGIRLKVYNAVNGCQGCYFRKLSHCSAEQTGACFKPWRENDVIFRKYDENKIECFHSYKRKKQRKTTIKTNSKLCSK